MYHRHSIRLPGYDYSQAGAYFITLVVQDRECLFGEITNGKMCLNGMGQCASMIWQALPTHFNVSIDEYVFMPDHMHGILHIEGAPANAAQPQSLGAIIQNYKAISTRRMNAIRRTRGMTIWQRNYYEHIIRNEGEWQQIQQYILNNPVCWGDDQKDPLHTLW
jgi:putative transposase